jgi:predicted DNA-binding WGR domain protein
MTNRIFHCSEGTAHKFWSVAVDGCTQTVAWGRIGTAGQEQTKTFATAEEAAAETAKLVASKIKKGYTEVSAEAAESILPKPRRKLTPWTQMLLPFDEEAAILAAPPQVPPPPVAPTPATVTLELF